MMAPMWWRNGLAASALVSAIVLVLVVAGCSWRVDTPPDPFRTPSPTTVLRDKVAAAEAAVAGEAKNATSDQAAAAAAEAAAVPIRLAALGGVSPTSSPRPSLGFSDAVDWAMETTGDCSVEASGEPLGALCTSILLSHSIIAATDPNAVTAQATIVVGDDDGDVGVIAQLALEHDKTRALFETIAARAKGGERTRALEQSARQRAIVTQLLALDGVENRTQPSYDVPAASVATAAAREATARGALVALGEAYAAYMVKAQVDAHSWVFEMALEQYDAAVPYGLTAAQVPALPGGVEPSAAP